MNQQQAQDAEALLRTIEAYKALHVAMKVWKYGGVAHLIDPLGKYANLNGGPVKHLLRYNMRIGGGRTDDELEEIRQAFIKFAALFNALPLNTRNTLNYDTAQEGTEFDPAAHSDVYMGVVPKVDGEPPVIACVYWRGLQHITQSFVVCEYNHDSLALTLHDFTVAARIPFSLKAFIFSRQGTTHLPLLPTMHSTSYMRYSEYAGEYRIESLSRHLMWDNISPDETYRQSARIVKEWLLLLRQQHEQQQQQQASSLVSRQGPGYTSSSSLARRPTEDPRDDPTRGIRYINGMKYFTQPDRFSKYTQSRYRDNDDDDNDEGDFSASSIRSLSLAERVAVHTQRDRSAGGWTKPWDEPSRISSSSSSSTKAAWTKDDDYYATVGDLEKCMENVPGHVNSLRDVCIIVEILAILYHATGQRRGSTTANDFTDMQGKPFFSMISGEKKGVFIRSIQDRPAQGHPFQSTLTINGDSLAQVLQNIRADINVFTLRVDMSECTKLSHFEIGKTIAVIRKRCPFVRHVICGFDRSINMIHMSLASWSTVTMLDMTLCPAIVCGPVLVDPEYTPLTETMSHGVVPHRRGMPPFVVTPQLELVGRTVRLISRLSVTCPLQAKHLMALYEDVDLMTLDDGPIVQGIATVAGARALVTIYGTPDELPLLVPWCQKRSESLFSQDPTQIYRPRPITGSMPLSPEMVKSLSICMECRSALGAFGEMHFPLCRSSCPRLRYESKYKTCDCASCDLREKCESDVFCVDVTLRDEHCRERFAAEMLMLYKLRGRVAVLMIVDTAGVSAAQAKETIAFLIELSPNNEFLTIVDLQHVLNGTVVPSSIYCPIAAKSGPIKSSYPVRVLTDRVVPTQQSAPMKTATYFVVDPHPNSARGVAKRWLVEYVLTQRAVRGLGITTADELVDAYTPGSRNRLDVEGITTMVAVLDRMGIVRVIGDTVFLSMRHYSMFVNVLSTNTMHTTLDTHANRLMAEWMVRRGTYHRGVTDYMQVCTDMLAFMKYHLVGDEHDPDRQLNATSMLQMLVDMRRAQLMSQLQRIDDASHGDQSLTRFSSLS